VFSQFYGDGQYTNKPAYRTTIYVLKDTVVTNQGLKDEVFQVSGGRFQPQFKFTSETEKRGQGSQVPISTIASKRPLKYQPDLVVQQNASQDAALSLRSEASRFTWVPWFLVVVGGATVVIAVWQLRRR
jgi:hypothetical protein